MNKEPMYRRTWFIILWLVLFFPVGLILMWVSKKWSTVIRSVITAAIVLLAIIGFVTSPDTTTSASTEQVDSEEKTEPVAAKAETEVDEDKAAAEAEKQKEAEAKAAEEKAAKEKEEAEKAEKEKQEKEKAEKEKQEKEAEPSLEETITKAINKTSGKDTNMDEKRIKELEINNNEETEAADDKFVIASLRADDNFSKGFIKGGIEDDSSRLFEKLFENEEVSNVILDWYFPLVDAYGNEEESVVNTIGMTRDTYEKINWDNFNEDNYPNIADNYFLHTVLNK